MRTDTIKLKHCCGYDNHYAPVYKEYTATGVVVFTAAAMSEKHHHKSSAIVYFFPSFSKLNDSSGNRLSFSSAGITPGDKLYFPVGEKNDWTVMKITPYLTGSDRVEHYRLECMA